MGSRRFRAVHLSGVLLFRLLALALGTGLAPLGFAQGDSSIQGTVSDSSGGAVPGVAIRINNVDTGTVRNQVTDEAGRYNAAALPAGRYEVRAEKTGFRTEDQTAISLLPAQPKTVDLQLQVRAVQQTL